MLMLSPELIIEKRLTNNQQMAIETQTPNAKIYVQQRGATTFDATTPRITTLSKTAISFTPLCRAKNQHNYNQRILTEGEGSVQLTSSLR